MSWLLMRSLPRAIAGWRDNFDRPNESPAKWPWAVWGSIPMSASIQSNKMVFGPANPFFNFGGWSFEHTCFTASWAVQHTMSALKSGAVAEIYRLIINKESWTRTNHSNLSDILAVDIQYRTAAVGSRIMVTTYENAGSVGDIRAETSIPQSTFDGNPHIWLFKIDQDRYLRIYLDGVEKITMLMPTGYQPGPGRRSVNFMNGMTTNVTIEDFILYDQTPPDPPFRTDYTWTSSFYDDFNRSNGPVGNGWTEIGSNAQHQVVNNSYGYISGTDGSRAILRSSGVSNGIMRVEATLGGNAAPNGSRDCSLIVRSNAAGTSGLSANVFSDKLYLARFTSSIGGGSEPTMVDLRALTSGISITSGVKIALCAKDDWAWIETVGSNSEVILFTNGINGLIPTSQNYCGLRVERAFFATSSSFNDCRILV